MWRRIARSSAQHTDLLRRCHVDASAALARRREQSARAAVVRATRRRRRLWGRGRRFISGPKTLLISLHFLIYSKRQRQGFLNT